MFQVRDKDGRWGKSGISYHRTREEAEARVRGSMMVDTEGEHPGSEYLVIEEIDRESKPCVFCGNEVEADDEATDFCRSCFYSGRHLERKHADLIGRIGDIAAVTTCDVWHTGGGCFNLAIRLADGRLLTPSVGREEEDGIWPEPGLPEEGEQWSLVISESEEAWNEWDESKIVMVQRLYSDDGLVAAVADVSSGGDGLLWGKAKAAPEARTYLVARFDVTDLTEKQRDSLSGYVQAQAEAVRNGDEWDYPDVAVTVTEEVA